MSNNPTQSPEEPVRIDLRNPPVAALLAWLIPGAGHLYQRRYAKGLLFMVCILGTWFFGLGISGGRAVYASFEREDFRWQYICQLGVGVPALPAIVQNRLVIGAGQDPLIGEGMMAPPEQPVIEGGPDMLARWHEEMPTEFEMGTLYTMIAGLLNVLAIYDAYAGPVAASEEEDEDKPPPDDDQREASDS